MEVASLFTNRKSDVEKFEEYLKINSGLVCLKRDQDTAYFSNKTNNINELYYHFELNDIEEEFSYNYSEDDAKFINAFFGKGDYFLIDISYRNSQKLINLLNKFYLDLESDFSFDHKVLLHIDSIFIPLVNKG